MNTMKRKCIMELQKASITKDLVETLISMLDSITDESTDYVSGPGIWYNKADQAEKLECLEESINCILNKLL